MVAEARKLAPRPVTCGRCSRQIRWLPCPHCQKTGELHWQRSHAGTIDDRQRGPLQMSCPFCEGRGWVRELHLACRFEAPAGSSGRPQGSAVSIRQPSVSWFAAHVGPARAGAGFDVIMLLTIILAVALLCFILTGARPPW